MGYPQGKVPGLRDQAARWVGTGETDTTSWPDCDLAVLTPVPVKRSLKAAAIRRKARYHPT
jgi:hypothetical protein